MDLRHLSTLAAIVDCGSMARAAERLGAAPSTVTLHIQELETELGAVLLTRRGRGLALTDVGRAVYARACSVLAEIDQLQADVAATSQGARGRARLGAIEPTASLRLPGLLGRFYAERPQVEVVVQVAGTRTIAAQVADGELDLGICTPPPPAAHVRFEPLFEEPLALLLPAEHPFGDRPRFDPGELAGERLLLTEEACAYRRQAEVMLERAGVTPGSVLQIGSVLALVQGVAAGLGIALVPVAAATPTPPGTRLREVDGVPPRLTMGLVTASGSFPLRSAARAMAEFLRRELGGSPAVS